MSTIAVEKGRIVEARTIAGLSQEELARNLGLSTSAVRKWESGAGSPYPKTLKKIAEVTGKPISFFTGRPEDDPAPEPERTVPVMTQQAYRSRTADNKRATAAIRSAVERVEKAQKELVEAQAALKAALMMMEGA